MAFPKEPEALRQAVHLPESQNPVPQEGARDPSYKVVKQPQQTLWKTMVVNGVKPLGINPIIVVRGPHLAPSDMNHP